MKNTLLIGLGFMIMGVAGADAGVKGTYPVTGSEKFMGSSYSFAGTVAVTNYKSCKVNLKYNDGDKASLTATFKTALKETKDKQTVNFTWRSPEAVGTGTATFSGTATKHNISFTYKTSGLRGGGKGSKRL